MRITIDSITAKKQNKQKITMLTAYDYSFASIVDKAGIDIILVGDSMANVILGMESTVEISLDEMLNHSKAVSLGSERALIVGDMPYCSYQKDQSQALNNALRFINEAGCQAVKLEWYDKFLETAEPIIKNKIPVMGHIGFTPQTASLLGNSVIQGRNFETAKKLIKQAETLEKLGCFSIVLECVPRQLAKIITERIKIPTIGIGAGNSCDGQVLVINDLLGIYKKISPKFVRKYEDLFEKSLSAIKKFKEDVEKGNFPSKEESFSIKEDELNKLLDSINKI